MTLRIDPSLIPSHPTLEFEHSLWKAGLVQVGGIDEAGRGCLAGPVTAAVVILPPADQILKDLSGVRDSKQLSMDQRQREKLLIIHHCLAWSVGFASNLEIDQYGIVPATCLAIQRALNDLTLEPDHLLVDYLVLPDNPLPQTRLIKGDARSLSIAAASILAKTHRDEVMISAAEKYPQYGFETNFGYGTASHRTAIQQHGTCPLHRKSFAPMRGQS